MICFARAWPLFCPSSLRLSLAWGDGAWLSPFLPLSVNRPANVLFVLS